MKETDSLSKFNIEIVRSKNIEQTSRDIVKAENKANVTSFVRGACIATTAVGVGGVIMAAIYSLQPGNIEMLPVLKGIEITSSFISIGAGLSTAYLPSCTLLRKREGEANAYLNLRSKILRIGGINPHFEPAYYNIMINGVRLHRKNATAWKEQGLNEYVDEAYQIYDEITTNHYEKDPVLQKKLAAYHIVRR